MQKIISIIAVVFFIALSADSYSQLQVTPNNNAALLAQTLAGAGVIVSGATLNCPNSAGSNPSGTFVGTASNIGIAGGVLLTTGDIINAVGPNNSSSAGTDNGVTFNDPNIMAIEPQAIYDVCILEFNAKPSCDTMAFTFAFGSEEYPEYVNLGYNDAFGIFITGPNPSGPAYTGYNMALLPATTTPVAINNVNNGTGGFLPCPTSATTGPCMNCAYYVDNCSGTTVQYDGFTKPITVKLHVTPCSSYHLKLAIADAGDGVYDSGVFFVMQSLKCVTTLTVTATSTSSQCTTSGSATVTNVTGGQAPYTYTWSNGQTTSAITGLSSGTYTITAVDANGCINGTQTVTIAAAGGFTVTPAQTPVTCFGSNNASALVSTNGGTTPFTYAWSTNPVQTTSAISGIAAGNYTCVITDATGCIQTIAFTITQPPAMIFTTSSTSSACTANNGTATATNVTGGTSPYTYSWNTNPVQNTQTATGLSAGNYSVTVTDANGCTNGIAVTVAGSGGFTAAPSQINVTCFGSNNASAHVSANGGTTPFTYAWSTNPVQTTSSVSGISAGNYTCVITDAMGCIQTISFIITQPPAVTGSITNPVNVSCFGGNNGSATASGSGGTGVITYLWNTNPAQTTPTASHLIAGNYVVTIKDANGCVVTQSVTITQPSGMTILTSATPAACRETNGTATVTSTGGALPYSYIWLTNPAQTTPTASNLGGGTYTVIVADANGCTQSQSVVVGGGSFPIANFNFNPNVVSLLDPWVNFTDGSSGNPAIWIWNFGDTVSGNNSSALQNPAHVYSDTGTYCITLLISDTSGICRDSIVKCLKVESPYTFYIPNSFTPNFDGKNEIFTGYGTCIKNFHILIFNRWGNLIFESYDLNKGWNGAVNNIGKLVEEDVYVWKITIMDIYKKEHKYIGRVTMIR